MLRSFSKILSILNNIAGVLIVAIMILISMDVLLRTVIDLPLPGVPEIVKMTVVVIVWLQIPFALRADRHLRSELIAPLLSKGTQRAIYGLNCLAGALIFGLIVLWCYDDLLFTFARGTFEGEDPVRVPVWPVWAVLVACAALTVVEYMHQLFNAVVRGRLPSSPIEDRTEDLGGEGHGTLIKE